LGVAVEENLEFSRNSFVCKSKTPESVHLALEKFGPAAACGI